MILNGRSLVSIGMRSLSLKQKNAALDHILDYFNQNYDNLHRITNAELEVSVEKPRYILTGKIDLLLDFKSLILKQSKNLRKVILYCNAISSSFTFMHTFC